MTIASQEIGATPTIIYPHRNHVGSTIRHTDSSQSVVNYYEYDAFGNLFQAGQSVAQQYRFNGKELDPDAVAGSSSNRRYSYPFRSYVPARGTFLQQDPLRIGNFFSRMTKRNMPPGPMQPMPPSPRLIAPFAMFTPSAFVDPTGLWGLGDHRQFTEKPLKEFPWLESEWTRDLVIECVVSWNLDNDNTHPDQDAWHGMVNVGAYNTLVETWEANFVTAQAQAEANGNYPQEQCQDMVTNLGHLLHALQDVNSHRGVSDWAHGLLHPDDGGYQFERRKRNADSATRVKVFGLQDKVQGMLDNCYYCQQAEGPDCFTWFYRTVFPGGLEIVLGFLGSLFGFNAEIVEWGTNDHATGELDADEKFFIVEPSNAKPARDPLTGGPLK